MVVRLMSVVSAKGLRKHWDGVAAVDGVDLCLERGELRGLLGPNGAGKTTVLRILFGLVRPDAGMVEVLGQRLYEHHSAVLPGVAGFVESPTFYPYLSGRANLEILAGLDGDRARARIDELLDLVNLSAHSAERAGGYSSGMRQRLGIAAALMRAPELLLLDEPTSGLDPAGAREMRALLRRAADDGVAVLLSSHDIATVEDICHSYTVLRAGTVVWDGSAPSLLAAAPEPAHILETSDDRRALAIARNHPGVKAAARDSDGLTVAAAEHDLDEYMCALGRAGVGVRRLDLAMTRLEAMFFALTEGPAGLPAAAPLGPEDRPPLTVAASAGPEITRAGGAVTRSDRAGGELGAGSVYRIELRKLANQISTRAAAIACCLGPFGFALILALQSSVPSDTLFGRWVHTSGFALSLVVLSFAGSYGLPILAGVLAGDIFSAEDRYDTWKTVLTRSCSRQSIFIGKALAAGSVSAAMVLLLAVSSLAAGLLLTGDQSLVSLDGTLLSPWACLGLVLVSWAFCLLPTLAFTSMAILFSVRTRNGIAGVLGPGVVGLTIQLLLLVGTGIFVQTALVASAFEAWHGLLTAQPYYGPLVRGAVVSAAWIFFCLALAWVTFSDRTFAGTQPSPKLGWLAPTRAVATVAAVIAVLVVASSLGPPGVTAARLDRSIASTFDNLTILQQRLLGHQVPAGAALNILPTCTRHGGLTRGPSDDWLCHLDVYSLTPGSTPYREASVTYDVSVTANGCYQAEAPPTFVGEQTMRAVNQQNVINPLFAFNGCFDTA